MMQLSKRREKMMQLCKFCGDYAGHRKPIYHNGFSFITNGYYVLRFAGQLEDAADVTETRPMAAFIESLFPSAAELADMRHAPHVVDHRKVTKCKNCLGCGVAKKCHHCAGDGVVVFSIEHHNYECECKECQGRGTVPAVLAEGGKKCRLCEGWGEGIWTWQGLLSERIGAARLCPSEMHILSHLPLIAWAAHGIHGHFVFMGGDGVLIGRKTPPEDY